jgi:hypothetical protein
VIPAGPSQGGPAPRAGRLLRDERAPRRPPAAARRSRPARRSCVACVRPGPALAQHDEGAVLEAPRCRSWPCDRPRHQSGRRPSATAHPPGTPGRPARPAPTWARPGVEAPGRRRHAHDVPDLAELRAQARPARPTAHQEPHRQWRPLLQRVPPTCWPAERSTPTALRRRPAFAPRSTVAAQGREQHARRTRLKGVARNCGSFRLATQRMDGARKEP